MPTERKAELIREAESDLERAAAAVLADYLGPTVRQMTERRRALAQQGVT
jgi:ribosomal protein L10